MKEKTTYFYKFKDGKALWASPNKERDFDTNEIIETQERIMLFPDEGKMLQNKTTGEYSAGIWLKDSKKTDWEEVSEESYKEFLEKENFQER